MEGKKKFAASLLVEKPRLRREFAVS